ncbi:MAG: UvrB/UvrC motif-containing protein [Verrucomicrobia bacterium]|nr:UvrB/UvrC motif-containing protein [Verrucomicrobiota bacterium]
MTHSIKRFLAVTEYRREKQLAYNTKHHITPRSVTRAVEESLSQRDETRQEAANVLKDAGVDVDYTETLGELEEEMLAAANNLEFEKAALLRDQIRELKQLVNGSDPAAGSKPTRPVSYRKTGKAKRRFQ